MKSFMAPSGWYASRALYGATPRKNHLYGAPARYGL